MKQEGNSYKCPCGAVYELYEYHSMMRDKDSLDCEFCGREILHWNGTSIWFSKLISGPQIYRKADDENNEETST